MLPLTQTAFCIAAGLVLSPPRQTTTKKRNVKWYLYQTRLLCSGGGWIYKKSPCSRERTEATFPCYKSMRFLRRILQHKSLPGSMTREPTIGALFQTRFSDLRLPKCLPFPSRWRQWADKTGTNTLTAARPSRIFTVFPWI